MQRAGQAAKIGFVLSAAAIIVATQLPSAAKPAASTHALGWTLTFDLADALRNVLLFAPLGALLTLSRASPARTLCVGFLLSAAVELSQLVVPGRLAAPFDVVANTLGAALGIFAVRTHRLWLCPSPGRARILCAAVLFLAGIAVAMPAVFFSPASTGERLFGHRSPLPFEALFPYRGEVVSARLDALDLPHGPIEDSDALWASLLADRSLVLEMAAGDPPAGQAGFLAVSDIRRTEVLFVGPNRTDLVYQFLTRGSLLGLEPARIRLLDALRPVRAGDLLRVRVEHRGADVCVAVDGLVRCGLGFTAGDGWMLIAPRFRVLHASRRLIGAAWLAVLFFPLGFWTSSRAALLALAAGGSLALLAAPAWLGLLDTRVVALLAPIAGIASGRLVREPARRWLGPSRA